MSYYRNQLEDWLKTIDVKADRVLDIGGAAKPVKDRVKSWDVKEYKILDSLTEESVVKPDYREDICWLQRKDLGKFDVIFMLEVAEYLFNPHDAMDNIKSLLSEKSIFYSSWPAIYPVHSPISEDHFRYTHESIFWLCANMFAGSEQHRDWEIEIIPRIATKGREALRDFYRLEGMHPVKSDEIYNIGYLVKCIKK